MNASYSLTVWDSDRRRRQPLAKHLGLSRASAVELGRVYRALGSRTKEFMMISGLGKYANFEKNRNRFEYALLSFLELP